MKTHRITKQDPTYDPAYVANGFVGLRVGTNPFTGQTGVLAGFTGSHERFGVEAYAPIPTVQTNLSMDGSSLLKNLHCYEMIEQAYDFSNGELSTTFAFTNARGQRLKGTSMIYTSRTCPSIVIQETQVEVMQACELRFSTLLETNTLPIRTRLTVVPKADVDGVLWIESRDGSTTTGIATYLKFEGEGEFREIRQEWGYEQERLTKSYSVKAEPGRIYKYRMMTSYVPGALHSEPHWQAVRMIKLAQWKGFDRLRDENRKAWEKLWESRVRIIGASEEWQDLVDSSFFYLYSTIHGSSPQSMAPFGLSRRDDYMGHVFWDTESFMFMLPLFTDPSSAKAMLDYRYNQMEAARHNAMLNGYNGIQFPWQSGTSGDEVTPAAYGEAGEVHVNMDVALAFIAYAQVSGDEVFLRERAWPVVKGVADWIESRVTRTERGYEILNVTGMDEGTPNIDNDSYTNIICKLVLTHADRIAQHIGYPAQVHWKKVADAIFIPIHPELQIIETYEGNEALDEKGYLVASALMAMFPYGYSYSKQVDENTIRYLINSGMGKHLWGPMLTGFLGVFPAWVGDRKTAREYYDEGNMPFSVDPYLLCLECSPHYPPFYKTDNPVTIFVTNRGSLMTGLMMGLTHLDIWKEDLDQWFSGPIVMPEGWNGIVLEKVYLKGRAARITAMHGDASAKIEWLD